ncbi:MAG: Ger(x)C family spore germination protein [Pelosinus sp.]|nr:Ger(x)C family spore germination protein [Pelosinus sp.]
MVKQIFLLTLMILSLLFSSGCWDYIEYENLAQATGLGFDFDASTGQITVTLQYAAPKKGGSTSGADSGSKVPVIVRAATDTTIMGALTKLQEVIPRKIFYGYINILIVGKEAAAYRMKEIIDLTDRTPAIQNSAELIIASGKAEDILSLVLPTDTINSTEKTRNLANLSPYTGAAYSVSISDFQQMLAIGGWEATAPYVIETPGSKKEEDSGQITDNIHIGKKTSGTPRIAGLAVFKQDKLVGSLDLKESLGYNWITGKTIKNYKSSTNETGDTLSYQINNSSHKVIVKIENGLPVIYLTVKVNANLRKYYTDAATDYLSPAVITDLETKLDETIRTDIDAALQTAKRLNADIFGFGFALFRTSPNLWQEQYESQWDTLFPQLQVHVSTEVKIINTGTNIKNFIIK